MIHPTAVVHPGARVHPSVVVGPYSVIDEHVEIGPDCRLGPHVLVTGHTRIGSGNRLHAGAVIGDAPQDLKYADQPTCLRIGDNNSIREHVTIHRANSLEEDTVVGSHCLFMAHSHVGHNARIDDHVIVANGALVAGHAQVESRVFISGNCLLHQFVRVGGLALMQGGSAISKDLPPYVIARGDNGICGLNVIGLRRAGMSAGDRLELKRLYHAIFRGGRSPRHAAEEAQALFHSVAARRMIEFILHSKRGVCTDRSGLFNADDED